MQEQSTSKQDIKNNIICIENNNLYDAINEEMKHKLITVKVEEIECEDFETDLILLDHPTCPCKLHNNVQTKELYENHIIKEELVIGPEIVQIPTNLNTNNLKTHVEKVDNFTRKQKKIPWNALTICQFCKKTFTKRSNLKRHHDYFCQKKDVTAKKMNNDKLKYGMFTHPFICDYCKKSYTHKSSLVTHIKSHIGLSQKYQCHLCEKKYTKKHNLSCHIQSVHLKVMKYSCKYCKRKFAWRFALKSHEKTHL